MIQVPKIARIFIAIMLVLTVLYTPFVHRAAVPKAEAIFCSNCAEKVTQAFEWAEAKWNAAQNTISAAANTVTSKASFTLFGKEFFLDQIAFDIAQLILKKITSSIVTWINSGFQGSPAFVTDIKGSLLEIADQEAGKLINGTEIDFICSPFRLDVRIALAVQYQGERNFTPQVQCTLSGAIDNIEGFINGNFADGGWAGWFELTQKPQNTPYGAYLAFESELNARIVDEQGRTIKEWDWGSGTLSKKLCELVEAEGTPPENCFINMPGKYIEEALTFQLTSGPRSLIAADEINEIIGALFAQLAQQAITGINGLLGLSQSGYGGGSGSYLDAMNAEQQGTSGASLIDILEQALLDEFDYQDLYIGVQAEVDALEAENARNRLRYPSCYNVRLSSELADFRSDAVTAELSAGDNIFIINDMILEVESLGADTLDTIARKQEIFNEFQDLRFNGILHTEIEYALAVAELRQLDIAIADFEDEMSDEIRRCQRLLNNQNNENGGGE